MSSFKAFKMINWMYFQNQTIYTKGYTALVGVNGSGKSTVIDAMQCLLLGRGGSRFNASANADNRTLKSYVRGAVGLEGKQFLREKDVVTYLAMELDIAGKRDIICMYTSYLEKNQDITEPVFFHIEGMSMSDDLFIRDKKPKVIREFTDYLKANNIKFKEFGSIYSYKIKLKELFGLKDEEKYFKTLTRAVGIKNIKSCNDFMNKFVLDKNNINLDSLKSNITSMDRLNKEIEVTEGKLTALEKIIEVGHDVKRGLDTESLIKCEINEANILANKNLLDSNEYENSCYEKERLDHEANKNSLNLKLEGLNEQKRELEQALNEIAPNLAEKQISLDKKRNEIERLRVNINTINIKIDSQYNNLNSLLRLDNSYDSFIKYIRSKDFTTEVVNREFIDFRNSLRELKESFKEDSIGIKLRMKQIMDEHRDITKKIEQLEANKPVYKDYLVEFKHYLEKGLYDKYQEKIDVKFLAEYLDITDDSWRNAIEGYLNNQRLYIVVDPKYYNDALSLYDENKDFCSTNIIDSTKLGNYDVEPGSLAEYIVSSNLVALNYARYILNKVHCCDNVRDLNNYSTSITRECMRYHNFSVGRLKKSWYDTQYIGSESLKNNLIRLKKMDLALNERGNEIKGDYDKINQKIKLLDELLNFADGLIDNHDYFLSIDKEGILDNEIAMLEDEINFYVANPTYISINSSIEALKNDISAISKNINDLWEKINECFAAIKANNVNSEKYRDTIELLESERENFTDILIEKANTLLKENRVNQAFINNLKKEQGKQNKYNSDMKGQLSGLMREANNQYLFSYEPNYECLGSYINEYQKINKSLLMFQSQLVDFQNKSRKLFFNTFLTKLYKSIEDAQQEIKNLNYSLGTFRFGEIFYEIKYDITQIKELATIYNFAKKYNDEDLENGAVYLPGFNSDKDRVEKLVTEYMFSDSQQKRDLIVDYRNYMDFDILMHTPTGVKSFNEVKAVQSGGEVQVPFYILSAVAFQQTLDYRRNKDAFCIMLFDEAFDKMDAQRIDQMLKFYRDRLNVQPVLAMPDKLSSIYNNVDTILTVVRENNVAQIEDFSHEI